MIGKSLDYSFCLFADKKLVTCHLKFIRVWATNQFQNVQHTYIQTHKHIQTHTHTSTHMFLYMHMASTTFNPIVSRIATAMLKHNLTLKLQLTLNLTESPNTVTLNQNSLFLYLYRNPKRVLHLTLTDTGALNQNIIALAIAPIWE